MQKLITLLC